jgi:hypothetical protein
MKTFPISVYYENNAFLLVCQVKTVGVKGAFRILGIMSRLARKYAPFMPISLFNIQKRKQAMRDNENQ